MTANKMLNQAKLTSPPVEPDNLAHKQYVDNQVQAVNIRFNSLAAMAYTADAPHDGRPYMRQSGTWNAYSVPELPPGIGAIVGEIRLLPFRAGEMPFGWYFCNGDRFHVTTAQGGALAALPNNMKADWGIGVSGDTISLPTLFDNGEGLFLRPVDNHVRLPGNRQDDATRNITGSFSVGEQVGLVLNGAATGTTAFYGAFKGEGFAKSYAYSAFALGPNTVGDLHFDSSRVVPTAHENRPRNIGMTPAIFLGV